LRNIIALCLLPLLVGCADFDFSVRPSFLDTQRDGPDLPRYLDKRESVTFINSTTHSRLVDAERDALLMLGCSKIREEGNTFRGDRPFIIGFVCGVGGETLYVTTEQVAENSYSVHVVSYKRCPYPEATRFLDGDFRDLLAQLLSDPHDVNTP
jgi:hypothetical protein